MATSSLACHPDRSCAWERESGCCGGGGCWPATSRLCHAGSARHTTPHRGHRAAQGFCFFDLQADPLEKHDLSADPAHAKELKTVQERLAAVVATVFQTTDSDMVYGGCAPSWAANLKAHRNFNAPMCATATPKSIPLGGRGP